MLCLTCTIDTMAGHVNTLKVTCQQYVILLLSQHQLLAETVSQGHAIIPNSN